jgi:hypothetical protein
VAFWRDACNAVKDADGNVNGFNAVRYLLMRPGGLGNPAPFLPEDSEAVKNMRKGTFDLDKIRRRQQAEEEIARAKEERRQANKRRYRPRGQVDRERAERRAALAAQKAQELEATNPTINNKEAFTATTNNEEFVTTTNEETPTTIAKD